MYIEYFLVTFSYHVVLIDGINLTEDAHTDSPDLHDGLITILVPFLHMGLDNAFGMSQFAMSRPSCALITAVKRVPSMLMVGLVTSSCSIYVHCVLPFAQCWHFIVLSLFSVKKKEVIPLLFAFLTC